MEIEIPYKSVISSVYLLLHSPDKHDSLDIAFNWTKQAELFNFEAKQVCVTCILFQILWNDISINT